MVRAQNKRQSGFTIIEVMIVLAIAGVILMLVFLAIPALQRNNRNTQMRNDVASVLGLVNEFSTNNNGRLPVSACSDVASGDIGLSAVAACNAVTNKVGTIRSDVTVTSGAAWPAGTAAVTLNFGSKCNGNAAVTAEGRAVAALFRVETASATQQQCQSS